MKRLPLAWMLLVLSGTTSAQSFNLDIDHASHPAAQLPDSYGGEPYQQGRWQRVVFPLSGPLGPTPLTDVNGVATGVTIEADKTGQANSPNCGAGWLADDVQFYDGIRRQVGALLVRFSGLEDGLYTLYVYGVDEQAQGSDGFTSIRVSSAGSSLPVLIQNQSICGPAHQSNRTFAATSVRVVDGVLLLRFTKGFTTGQSYSLSGIQLDSRVGTTYCSTRMNSTGAASTIRAVAAQRVLDEASVSANDLTLAANNLPPGANGFFFYSRTRHPGGFGTFGGGFRCLIGALGRLPVADTQLSPGYMLHTVDYNQAPNSNHLILAGSTWHFQGYYTDPAAGGFNLTNGLTITFGI